MASSPPQDWPSSTKLLAVQAQRPADLLDLVDEAGQIPQRPVVGLVAAERPELVVVVVLDARRAGTRCRSFIESRWWRPGPPCSSSTLRSGLVPTRLVQTRNSPAGVLTGIMRAPPEMTSGRAQVEVSK